MTQSAPALRPGGSENEPPGVLTPDDATGFRAGTPAAVERVFCAMWPRLFQAAYRIFLDRDEAQEAAQQGFVRACYVRHTLRGGSGAELAVWLTRIVRHTALDALRVRGRNLELSEDVFAPDEDDPSVQLEQREVYRQVGAALSKLGAGDRAALMQCEIEQLPQKAIAAGMGITVNALKVRLHRARRRFRDAFTKLNDRKL